MGVTKLGPECPNGVGIDSNWRPDLIVECENCGVRLTVSEWLDEEDSEDAE